LEQFGKLLAAYAERLVATVTVAQALSDSQEAALEKSLARDYGNDLRLNIEIDPAILGGIKAQASKDDAGLGQHLTGVRPRSRGSKWQI
jgi:F-type H+-transporting ATPase subunit delta